jgi:hypothetical protein
VFTPLIDLELSIEGYSYDFITGYYKCNLKNMPSQTSEIYRLGLKHMEKDEKQLPIEIENLNNMLVDHKKQISDMETYITKLVKNSTSTFYKSPVFSPVFYKHDHVFLFVSKIWISCKDEKNMNEAIDEYIKNTTPRSEDGYFKFENEAVAKGDPKNLDIVKDVLYKILKDKEIIKNIAKLI